MSIFLTTGGFFKTCLSSGLIRWRIVQYRGGRSDLMRTMEEFEELLEQGETLAEEGLLSDALSRFEQALALEPENPEVLEAIGRAFLALDRTEEAEASF